jgi:hypothetical protein
MVYMNRTVSLRQDMHSANSKAFRNHDQHDDHNLGNEPAKRDDSLGSGV